jgi:hypothetical protein
LSPHSFSSIILLKAGKSAHSLIRATIQIDFPHKHRTFFGPTPQLEIGVLRRAGLYLYVENVDKVVEKATKLGATGQGPVMGMFWGDRCGTIVDPDGYTWMIGTHKAEPRQKR